MMTLTIMRGLPREVDPVVYNMFHEDPGYVSYSVVGGLSDQIRELMESIELPVMNPKLFIRVGIKPPKGVLFYGPPGTGKTFLARPIASNIDANFLKTRNAIGLVAPAIAVGLAALTHTLGTLIPVIRASGFATVSAATVIGIVVGSFR